MADTPQQNGMLEHKNRTLMGGLLTMLQQSGFIKAFWGKAILMVNYLQNRSPIKSIDTDRTPYALWMGYKPNLSHLKIFGCIVYVLIQIDHIIISRDVIFHEISNQQRPFQTSNDIDDVILDPSFFNIMTKYVPFTSLVPPVLIQVCQILIFLPQVTNNNTHINNRIPIPIGKP